jgi:hypothetical protein
MQTIIMTALSPGPGVTDRDMATVSEILPELDEFVRDVRAGKA